MSVNSTECRAFPTMNMHLRAWSTIRYFCKTDFNITIGKCVGSDWNLLCSVLIRHKTVSQWRQSLSAHSQLYSLSNYNKTVPDSGPGPLPNTIYLLPPSDQQIITAPAYKHAFLDRKQNLWPCCFLKTTVQIKLQVQTHVMVFTLLVWVGGAICPLMKGELMDFWLNKNWVEWNQ